MSSEQVKSSTCSRLIVIRFYEFAWRTTYGSLLEKTTRTVFNDGGIAHSREKKSLWYGSIGQELHTQIGQERAVMSSPFIMDHCCFQSRKTLAVYGLVA